jgi:hypothetical protein
MEHTVKMGPGTVLYTPKFYNNCYRYSKIDRGIHSRKTHGQQGDFISPPLFFQNKKSELKRILEKKRME